MSIASALFALAAPVSTGTTAAASGIEANDVGLFSSKVASVLDAGLGEANTVKASPIGRLTAPGPLGLVLNQAITEDEAISGPAIETALPAAPEAVDTKVQPAVGDEPAVVEDVAETDDTIAPAAVFALVPTPQSTPVVTAASASTPQPLVANNSAAQTDIGLAIAANSSTPPPLVAENSAVQADIGAPSTVPVAPKVDTPVEQSRVSFIAAAPTLSTSKTPNDAASINISAPKTSVNLGATDTAEITLPEGFAITGEAETAPADLNIVAAAKAALPIMNAAPAVSDTASKTSEDAPVDAAPAQSSSTVAPKKSLPEVASAPLDPSMTKAVSSAVDQTRVAAPEAAKVAVQAAPSDNDKSTAASVVQPMTTAQILAAQVQVSVMAQISKPVPLATADVASAVIAAELSAEADQPASDQPAAAPADKSAPAPSAQPQAAPSIRAARHELAQQTSNAATTPAQPETTNGTATPSAKADATLTQATAQPVKTAETIAASLSSPAPVAAESQAASAVPADTQSVQQAVAPDRDLGLSTLSRATVETTAQLAAQIARKLDGRSTRFDMVLTPEDLGRVDVSLEIGKDGQLSARLAFDNPAAAADLKGRADELRRQLQDAGFQVAGDALDFSQRDPSAGNGGAFERQQQRNALFAGGSRLAAQADTPIVPAPGAWINHSMTPERVDLKV